MGTQGTMSSFNAKLLAVALARSALLFLRGLRVHLSGSSEHAEDAGADRRRMEASRPERATLHHVSGPTQLAEGAREFAPAGVRHDGPRRPAHVGHPATAPDDFGEIVFNLVEAELMSKTDDDTRADFHSIYDLDEAFSSSFRIVLEEE